APPLGGAPPFVRFARCDGAEPHLGPHDSSPRSGRPRPGAAPGWCATIRQVRSVRWRGTEPRAARLVPSLRSTPSGRRPWVVRHHSSGSRGAMARNRTSGRTTRPLAPVDPVRAPPLGGAPPFLRFARCDGAEPHLG